VSTYGTDVSVHLEQTNPRVTSSGTARNTEHSKTFHSNKKWQKHWFTDKTVGCGGEGAMRVRHPSVALAGRVRVSWPPPEKKKNWSWGQKVHMSDKCQS